MSKRALTRQWVVVANEAAAEFFVRETPQAPLVMASELRNAEGRTPDRELVSDRPGRSFDSVGGGRHGMSPKTDRKEVEAARFAASVVARIADADRRGDFRAFAVISAPRFLGHLRDAMDGTSLEPFAEVAKDIVGRGPEQALAALNAHTRS